LLQRMSLVVFSWDVIHRWHVLKSLSFPQLPWGLYRDYAITYPKQAHEMRVGSGWKPCRVRLSYSAFEFLIYKRFTSPIRA
jgi:hypothetical protein